MSVNPDRAFSIKADDCGTRGGCLPVGTTVNKVGRTTGWTSGSITNTCVNTGVSGSNIVQLCTHHRHRLPPRVDPDL